jgi:hypothetical protein
MDGALAAYETYVVDVEDSIDVPDFEVVVQAIVMGLVHRTIPGEHETSCGVPFRLATTPTRREQLTERGGKLCADCFTPHELAKAKANDVRDAERERRDEAEESRKRDEFFAALKTKRKPTQGER